MTLYPLKITTAFCTFPLSLPFRGWGFTSSENAYQRLLQNPKGKLEKIKNHNSYIIYHKSAREKLVGPARSIQAGL